MRSKDDKCFQRAEELELRNPCDRKIDGDRVIYTSRGVFHTSIDRMVLSDFGEARCGMNSDPYYDDIQPLEYRAPEVLLEIPFSYPVDIWNAGLMVWYNPLLTRTFRSLIDDLT